MGYKVKMLPSNSLLRRSSSSSSSLGATPRKLSSNKNYKQWTSLFSTILELNEKNYTKNSRNVTLKLQSIVESDVMNESKMSTIAILYILYERSVQELLMKTFPVSASLIDSLTSGSSEDIFNTVQPVIQEHLQRLQIKLRNTSSISGSDVGVACLLINMYRLDKMAGRTSPVATILDQIIKDANDYVELISLEKHFSNDAFVILLFSLIWYSLSTDKNEVDLLKTSIRKGHVKFHRNMSIFGRVLALDIIEHTLNFDNNVRLYVTNYKKIINTQTFLLSGIDEYISGTPFPIENTHESSDSLSESFSLLKTQVSVEEDDVFSSESTTPQTVRKVVGRLDPEGSSGSEEDSKEAKARLAGTKEQSSLEQQTSSPLSSSSSSLSSIDETDRKCEKWTRKISQEAKMQDSIPEEGSIEQIIRIPERYVGRVVGLEGAIARKIELKSKASVLINKKDDPVRPNTTCLTAHRLITGALGMRSQMEKEQVHEEKQKIRDAKVKRNAEKQEVLTREVKLYGSERQIDNAKTLINEIINNIITLSVPLKLTVEDLLRLHGNKIKTIENLLNVYVEIAEQEDLTVVLDISGDKKSCADARKLIFEDVCQFKTESGQMFYLPAEIESVVKSDVDLLYLFGVVKDICEVNINKVVAPRGPAVFISGIFANIGRAVNIFQVANFQLALALAQEGNAVTCTQLCNFIQEKFGRRREVRRSLSRSPTLLKNEEAIVISSDDEEDEDSTRPMNEERKCYSRSHLIKIGFSMKDHFPELLNEFLKKDEDAYQVIIDRLDEYRLPSILRSLDIGGSRV